MKAKPVRVCDVSRVIRISSTSLIAFLKTNGYSIKGDFRSPLSGRMVELIQTGYNEGPPFEELNPFIPRAEAWEKQNTEKVSELHTPTPEPIPIKKSPEEHKPRRKRKPRLPSRSITTSPGYTGRIQLSPIDLELIQQVLALGYRQKKIVREFLTRKMLLEALAKLD